MEDLFICMKERGNNGQEKQGARVTTGDLIAASSPFQANFSAATDFPIQFPWL